MLVEKTYSLHSLFGSQVMAVCNWLNFLWLGSLCYDKVCYDNLGCFENKPPFNNANSELPDSPDEIKVSFLLYTVSNTDIHQSITTNTSQIKTTEYRGSRRTVFLIHGYLGGPEDTWILDAKNAILKKEDANIVVVDWENGADDLGNYFQAAANTRIVGALTAHLMTSLFTSAGAKYEEMYIVGYSLGAHVAGYAGEKVPNLGRITGLDPAYSAFSENEPAVRLDTTDATFVDIIHTDGKQWIWGFGIRGSIGHADFFPNGGLNQPGCESWFFLKQSTCDHGRATEYFVESINSACSFKAAPCQSWRKFKRDQCSCESDCSRMGFAEKQPGVSGDYYLETNSQSPFCKI